MSVEWNLRVGYRCNPGISSETKFPEAGEKCCINEQVNTHSLSSPVENLSCHRVTRR